MSELVADASVEARRFLARVKPRTLRTESGRVITTAELAESLVKRAGLEHAVLDGERPFCLCGQRISRWAGRTGNRTGLCGPCNRVRLNSEAPSLFAEARRSIASDLEAAREQIRQRTEDLLSRPIARCVAPACAEIVLAKGLCRKHYVAHRAEAAQPCATPGCGAKSHARGRCIRCYNERRAAERLPA